MKSNTFILSLLLISQFILGQNKNIFKTQTIFKSDAEITAMINEIDSLNNKNKFFEDEKYIVYPECRGEWGGVVIFKNKDSKKEFICKSTCPISVTKFKSKYIVTNTLNHLVATSEILEIANPETLEVKVKDKRYNFEKLGKQGAKSLIDVYHFSTLCSFIYNEKLYHIVSNQEKTFIAEIIDGKFKNVQDLSERIFWTYHPSIIKVKNTILIALNKFDNRGYIEIKGNEVSIFHNK